MTVGEEARPAGRPRICLNMIVRNESHIIHELIAAVADMIDCWMRGESAREVIMASKLKIEAAAHDDAEIDL